MSDTSIPTSFEELAIWAKALGHPARVAILHILAERQTCICGDITDQLPYAQSTVSQHLKALKQAGLIKGEIDGVRTCYCLNDSTISDFTSKIQAFTNTLVQSSTNDNENCC